MVLIFWLILILSQGAQMGFASSLELHQELRRLVSSQECARVPQLARTILQQEPNDLEALQAIEKCTRDEMGNRYTNKAKEILGSSQLISIVPEVHRLLGNIGKKEKLGVADYLALSEFYQKLGEPEKELQMLEEALNVNKEDPRIKLIVARSQFEVGNKASARQAYQEYLRTSDQHSEWVYFILYVAAMAYPIPVLSLIILLLWGLGGVLKHQLQLKLNPWVVGVGIFMTGILVFEFVTTGSVIPLGILLATLLFEGFLCAWIPLWRHWLSRATYLAMKWVANVLNGVKFARKIAAIPTGWRVLIALGTLFVLGTVVPLIEKGDVRYALSGICLFFFYGNVGSLIVTVVRSSKSLQSSMRWIGVAATLPFMVSYVLSHWSELGQPFLYARIPSGGAIQGFLNYLIFWSFSLVLALHLSKILADALIQPLKEILSKVQLIESGNFTARAQAVSKDELGALATAVNHMAQGLQRREYVEKTFSRYIDPKVAERILSGDQDEVNIAGQRLSATILFADIRGFTRLSEQMPPEAVIQVLNTYFGKMVATVRAHGGVIDKFIGDAMLCVWGVPRAVAHGTELAVRCAWSMQKEMELLNQEFLKQGIPQIGVGIGIHCGTVVAGTLGSNDRMEYTVIGDVVNTAQRVEGKAAAGTVLLTQEAYEVVRRYVEAASIGEFSLKGKAHPVPLWQVSSVKERVPQLAA
ncbi:HAMP domain-containing protein [bacterium]|nr:HAMP domain-containing protein [bacterium]NBW99022.1 HAMP domain-containing protein [bacterium]NBX82077.1 HAMP domain-containing protein [bacterium]